MKKLENMKKLIFTVVTLVVIGVSSVSAQAVWGLRVGASRPTIVEDEGSWKGVFGVEAGPVLYYSLKNNFYINSGLMFSMKTFNVDDADNTSLTLTYLELPVYVGYSIPIDKIRTYAQLGPYIGYRLSAKVKWDGGSADMEGLKSINAGVGAMYGVNLDRFKIELGYQLGLVSIDNEFNAKINSLFLGVSYVF